MKKQIYPSLLLVTIASLASNLSAQTITNSSFDNNTATAFPGYGTPTGWQAGPNVGVNLGNTGQSVFADNGTTDGLGVAFMQNPGRILGQEISGFEIGETYEISFQYNSRTFTDVATNGSLTLTLNIGGIGDVVSQLAVDTVAGTGNYFTTSAQFEANAETLTINFTTGGSGGNGDRTLLLDNVSISAIPEPSAFALLSGVVALGMISVRRRYR